MIFDSSNLYFIYEHNSMIYASLNLYLIYKQLFVTYLKKNKNITCFDHYHIYYNLYNKQN